MSCKMKAAWTGLLLAGMLSFAGGSQAADIQERTIKFAFVQQQDNHWGAGATEVRRDRQPEERRQDHRQALRWRYPGRRHRDAVSLQGGTVEMTMMGSGLLVSMIQEYVLFDLPFLFNDPAGGRRCFGWPGRQDVDGQAAGEWAGRDGLLGAWLSQPDQQQAPGRQMGRRRRAEDQGDPGAALHRHLQHDGRQRRPDALAGTLHGTRNRNRGRTGKPAGSIESSSFYEVQKYLSTTRHVYNPIIVLFSKKAWDQLTPDEQQLLLDAANEVKPYQRQVSRDMEANVLAL